MKRGCFGPGFTKTNLDHNSQLARRTLDAYRDGRGRVAATRTSVAKGKDPATIVAVALEELTTGSPKVRYVGGREARFLTRLKRFDPATLLDKGLHKQFGLGAS